MYLVYVPATLLQIYPEKQEHYTKMDTQLFLVAGLLWVLSHRPIVTKMAATSEHSGNGKPELGKQTSFILVTSCRRRDQREEE